MSTPHERVIILKAENQRLEQYLNDLSEEAWAHASTCDQWTVADVIAHITDFNKDLAKRVTDSLHTDIVKPESLPRRSNERVDAVSSALRVIEFRKELGSQLQFEFVKANRAMEQVLDQVQPDGWDKLCYRKTGAEPISNILDVLIVDVGVHRWDVTYPFDQNVKLSQDCLAIMVERYPHRPRWWDIVLPSNHPPLPVRFRFMVSGATTPGTDFVIANQGEKYMEVAGDPPTSVTFRCDAETFALVAYGRIKPQSAISKGSLTYQGDQEWADIFIQSFIGG
ncbi:MAG: maleylpyruvate isomerase family mycothiol-dependent enzyme [Candidatus Binatia bacterium]